MLDTPRKYSWARKESFDMNLLPTLCFFIKIPNARLFCKIKNEGILSPEKYAPVYVIFKVKLLKQGLEYKSHQQGNTTKLTQGNY